MCERSCQVRFPLNTLRSIHTQSSCYNHTPHLLLNSPGTHIVSSEVDELLMRDDPAYAVLRDIPFGDIITARSRTTGMGFLHYAVKSCDQETILFLISAGADAAAQDETRNNPLHLLAQFGDEGYDVAKMVLDNVDLNMRERMLAQKNYSNERPLDIAMYRAADDSQRSSMVQLLVDARETGELNRRGSVVAVLHDERGIKARVAERLAMEEQLIQDVRYKSMIRGGEQVSSPLRLNSDLVYDRYLRLDRTVPDRAADAIISRRRKVAAVKIQASIRGAIMRTTFTKMRPSMEWARHNRRRTQQRERREARKLMSSAKTISDVDRAVAIATRQGTEAQVEDRYWSEKQQRDFRKDRAAPSSPQDLLPAIRAHAPSPPRAQVYAQPLYSGSPSSADERRYARSAAKVPVPSSGEQATPLPANASTLRQPQVQQAGSEQVSAGYSQPWSPARAPSPTRARTTPSKASAMMGRVRSLLLIIFSSSFLPFLLHAKGACARAFPFICASSFYDLYLILVPSSFLPSFLFSFSSSPPLYRPSAKSRSSRFSSR